MKKLNHWLRNYFGFSKTESNGFLVLVPLTFIIIFSPFVWQIDNSHNKKTDEADIRKLDSLVQVLEERIVFTEKENRTNYKKDFRQPFDRVPTEKSDKKGSYRKSTYERQNDKPPFKYKSELKPFDINTADTTQLRKIYGIGPVLSARIVKYRDLLGGFSSKDQYGEVYGLKEDVLEKLDSLTFINSGFIPKQVNLNDEPAFKLDDHPYISRKVAKAIDAYRFQHGKIDSLKVLYQIRIIDSATVQKMAPYLKF